MGNIIELNLLLPCFGHSSLYVLYLPTPYPARRPGITPPPYMYTQNVLTWLLPVRQCRVGSILNEEAMPPHFSYLGMLLCLVGSGEITRWQRTKPKIWSLFDEPHSSAWARVVSLTSVFFILISILSFCLKTHPNFRVPVIRQEISTEFLCCNKFFYNPQRPSVFTSFVQYYSAICRPSDRTIRGGPPGRDSIPGRAVKRQ